MIPYIFLFLFGIQTLFYGFPDINRFFEEWMDERFTLTMIMKFGTLNFAPTQITHPPLYHYLTFIPIAAFFIIGKLVGLFHSKIEFVRFYFNNTHYFFFIGRMMSYFFYWASAFVIFKIARMFFSAAVSHFAVLSYLLVPQLIFYASAAYPDALLILNSAIATYFFLKFRLDQKAVKYLYFASFFLGVSAASKYNGMFLGVMFIPLLADHFRNYALPKRDFYGFLRLCAIMGFLVFAGFFLCDPFFILQFKKYFHNQLMHNIETRYYWKDLLFGVPPGLKHLKELIAMHNINPVGFLVLLFGFRNLFKKYRKVFICAFSAILAYEVYFGVYMYSCSPLRFLNPLAPLAVLVFASGVDFVTQRRRLPVLLAVFLPLTAYSYFDVVRGLSVRPTHIQKARAFIEQSIPEFANICVMFPGYLPQLNMTRQSYFHFLNTIPPIRQIPGHELVYEPMENPEDYDPVLREIRVESMTKRPQYNLVRLDNNVATFQDLKSFLKKNNIEYILTTSEITAEDKEIGNCKVLTLVNRFAPANKRIYKIEHIDLSVFLYRVNRGKL